MDAEKVVEGAAAAAEETVMKAEMQLKPIHIIVMVITLLHAVAIGAWFLVYLGGSKGGSRTASASPGAPPAAQTATGSAGASSSDAGTKDEKKEDKKTQ